MKAENLSAMLAGVSDVLANVEMHYSAGCDPLLRHALIEQLGAISRLLADGYIEVNWAAHPTEEQIESAVTQVAEAAKEMQA
jgi:hypothetical protein